MFHKPIFHVIYLLCYECNATLYCQLLLGLDRLKILSMIQFFVRTVFIFGFIWFLKIIFPCLYLVCRLCLCATIIIDSISTFSPTLFSHRLVFIITISVFLNLCVYHPFRYLFSGRFFVFVIVFWLLSSCYYYYILLESFSHQL